MQFASPAHRQPLLIAGIPVETGAWIPVYNPYDGSLVGEIASGGLCEIDRAIAAALCDNDVEAPPKLTRYARHRILDEARRRLELRSEEFAQLITLESGLCIRETRHEVGRALDVLMFASHEALRDGGRLLSCDVSPHGQSRRVMTQMEPHRLALAITPFNHPLNQVAHKLAPAIAAGCPIILKPSEKTPLTAYRFAQLLYESGLPGYMLSILNGPMPESAATLINDARIEAVSFTGGTTVGKRISRIAGYKRLCLELGGHSPLLVLADADLDLAVRIALEGCFRNSGQRCTAIRRVLVDQSIAGEFTQRLAERAASYTCGDPFDEQTLVGTVIDQEAAERLEEMVQESVHQGAKRLCGQVNGPLFHPTILAEVPRSARIAREEAFGPIAAIYKTDGLDDAIAFANSTDYGLSCGVVTNNLAAAARCAREIRTGTVNINEAPGYRIELSPFGGVKDSGLGIKEGVLEAIRFFSTEKTVTWPM